MHEDTKVILDRVDELLRVEHAEMSESKRLNHVSWDNHIIALSTASVAFAFTFLPISSGENAWLAKTAVLSLVLAILVSIINYSISAVGFDKWSESVSKRQVQFDKIRKRLMTMYRRIDAAHRRGDDNAISEEQSSAQSDLEEIWSSFDLEAVIKIQTSLNTIITWFNHARGAFFVFGIVGLTVFGFCNLSDVSLKTGTQIEGAVGHALNADSTAGEI